MSDKIDHEPTLSPRLGALFAQLLPHSNSGLLTAETLGSETLRLRRSIPLTQRWHSPTSQGRPLHADSQMAERVVG